MSSFDLIIPAAGAGRRLNRDTPKPFIEISGKTILEHTISRFVPLPDLRKIIVAGSVEHREEVQEILEQSVPDTVSSVWVEGGAERQHSIYRALQKVGDVELVAVHDAVRPFIRREVIRRAVRAASEFGGSVVGIKVKDTIKKADEERTIVETPDRNYLWQAQTPQIFRKEVILEAYGKARDDDYLGTDDASLAERLGYGIKIIEGERDNLKITYPIDLKLAEILLEEQADEFE